jgi:hypothetical protein
MLGGLLGGLLGGFGLLSGINQQNRQYGLQRDAIKSAKDADAPLAEARRKLLELANSYNPGAENQAAYDFANQRAMQSAENGLKNLRAQFMAGGGSPAGDTEFNVRTEGLLRDVMDPLRAQLMSMKAGETAQKAAMYQTVAGIPMGNLAQTLLGASSQIGGGNIGPSIQMLAGSLGQILGGKGIKL